MLSQATRSAVLSILAEAINDPRLDEDPVSAVALTAARHYIQTFGSAPVRVVVTPDDRVIVTGSWDRRAVREPDRLEIRRFAVLLERRDAGEILTALVRNAEQHARAAQA